MTWVLTSTPIVEINALVDERSSSFSSRHDFPTPESPIMTSLNEGSRLFCLSALFSWEEEVRPLKLISWLWNRVIDWGRKEVSKEGLARLQRAEWRVWIQFGADDTSWKASCKENDSRIIQRFEGFLLRVWKPDYLVCKLASWWSDNRRRCLDPTQVKINSRKVMVLDKVN